MGLHAQQQNYPNVLPLDTRADAIGDPVLVADFKTIEFTVQMFIIVTTGALTDPDVPFEVGETVSGGTSGASANVIKVNNTTHVMVLSSVSGTFQAAEVLTGLTSGAEATISTIATPDFDIGVIVSNQELPPDPSLPRSPDNQYSAVGYSDQGDQVFYADTNPFNPKDMTPDFAGQKIFNVETNGARWALLTLSSYVGGSLYKTDMNLFSNFT